LYRGEDHRVGVADPVTQLLHAGRPSPRLDIRIEERGLSSVTIPMSSVSGASSCAARRAAVLNDPARKLPEIPATLSVRVMVCLLSGTGRRSRQEAA
jgi:hypothetical protein